MKVMKLPPVKIAASTTTKATTMPIIVARSILSPLNQILITLEVLPTPRDPLA